MEELISKKDLYDKIVKLELSALEQMKTLAKLGNTEEYNKMNAVLMERTAFKYDVVDAPVILEIPDSGIGDLSDGYHTFNKKNSGYLVLNKDGNKLSERYVRVIIDDLAKKAGLDIKISPHTMRHTFATDMLEEGADLVTVKELLGHESLDTTSIYTHITNEQIRKTYNMAHPRAKK